MENPRNLRSFVSPSAKRIDFYEYFGFGVGPPPFTFTRGSNKLAIACAIGWFVLSLIASASAPKAVDDPDFRSKLETAAGFQGFGHLLIFISIIAFGVTIYRNIMDKQIEETKIETKVIHGPSFEHSTGASYATHGSTIVTGSGKIENYTLDRSTINQKLREVKDFVDSSALADLEKSHAKLLVEIVENETNKRKPDPASVRPKLTDLLSIVSGAGGVTANVLDALAKIKDMLSPSGS
jgi:hypothetical protein